MSQWLSKVLGRKCKLIKQHPNSKREAKLGLSSHTAVPVYWPLMHVECVQFVCSCSERELCGGTPLLPSALLVSC